MPPAVLADLSEDRIERSGGRLKGQPWSLPPRSLARADHATGIQLTGVSAGNPKRTTAPPTAERLREAFQELTRTIIREGRHRRYHLTALSALHGRILELLDFPMDISTRLDADSHKPP